jgi:hypothetical protein
MLPILKLHRPPEVGRPRAGEWHNELPQSLAGGAQCQSPSAAKSRVYPSPLTSRERSFHCPFNRQGRDYRPNLGNTAVPKTPSKGFLLSCSRASLDYSASLRSEMICLWNSAEKPSPGSPSFASFGKTPICRSFSATCSYFVATTLSREYATFDCRE